MSQPNNLGSDFTSSEIFELFRTGHKTTLSDSTPLEFDRQLLLNTSLFSAPLNGFNWQ